MPLISAGLEEMIESARDSNVFKYKKTNKFNGCDFMTEYLYNKNPKRECSRKTLKDIPFCQEFDQKCPRKELPLSLRLENDLQK